MRSSLEDPFEQSRAICELLGVVMGNALLWFKGKDGRYEGRKQNSRNEKHANRDAKNAAREKYEEMQAKYSSLNQTRILPITKILKRWKNK